MNITPFNVEQFDYVQYTLPSLDMLIVAEKKEAIKILEQANEYLISTTKNYTRFLKEVLEWREHEKEYLPSYALEDIDEKVKDLATNISIIIGTTQTLNDTVSRLSGKTKSSDIKSTTGNNRDSGRNRNAEGLAGTEEELNKTGKVDQEKRKQALKDINDVIKTIEVKTPTQTTPKDTSAQEAKLRLAADQLLGAEALLVQLRDTIDDRTGGDDLVDIDDLTSGMTEIIREILGNPLLTEKEKDKLAKAEAEIDGGAYGGIYKGIKEAIDTVGFVTTEDYEGNGNKEEAVVRAEKAIEKVKQNAEQEAAVNDMNNTASAIAQGKSTVSDALSKINEAEAAGTITKEDAEKAREEAINKAADVLGISEKDKENLKENVEKTAEELDSKLKDIQEKLERGEITEEEAKAETENAQEQARDKNNGIMGSTMTTTKNSDGSTTTTITRSDGSTTTTTKNADGSESSLTKNKDGSTKYTFKDSTGRGFTETVDKDGKSSGPKDIGGDSPSSGGTNSSGTGGDSGGDSGSGPSSGGTNSGT